jgi:hypothetical protein
MTGLVNAGWTKTKKSKSLFLIYIQANSVVNIARARPGIDDSSSALQRWTPDSVVQFG